MAADLDARATEVLRALRAARDWRDPDTGALDPKRWWRTLRVADMTQELFSSGRWPIPETAVRVRLIRLTKFGLVEHRRASYTKTGKTRDEWRAREEVRNG